MTEPIDGPDSTHPNLNLTSEEKRVFGQLFKEADTENVGVVTGDVAVKFFEKSRLEPHILGEIWQIADTENRGFLTPAGFGLVLRLIGHVQAGRQPSQELGYRPGPLPKFDAFGGGANPPPGPPPARAIQSQSSGGGPIRVPPLAAEKANEYNTLFEKFGAQNGILPGDQARQIFEKAKLPNDVLGRIWNLADTEQRGALNVTEFIVAMHLLASYRSGALPAVPQVLPPGLYDAAARRGLARPQYTGQGQVQSPRPGDGSPIPGVSRQFSGLSTQRAQSPLTRPSFVTPPQSAQTTGGDWLINAKDKAQFDGVFASLDTSNRGFITGDEAVGFFGNSRLPEETLAQIWDLADINSEGRLNRDEFAVAMYLIRQQRGTRDGRGLASTLPPNLIPPSMRQQTRPPQQPTAPAFDNEAYATTKSASEDLFGLDAFSPSSPASQPQPAPSSSHGRSPQSGLSGDAKTPASPPRVQSPQDRSQPSSVFKPFVPSSSFGQSLASNNTGGSDASGRQVTLPQRPSAADDLLGETDPEESKKLTAETTELGNLSNQVGQLSTQMKEVTAKRETTGQDLSKTSSQKRLFESRLSQLRSLYEQEVKEVKTLEERLSTSRSDISKLQQEIAMVEGTQQDLQVQHRQLTEALQADQQENVNLKERMRLVNTEISELRPQLDKLRSDARQQKGLVAINKKQLVTNEGEKDKLSKDVDEATQAAAKAAEQARSQSISSASQAQTPAAAAASVASPALSTTSQSTNPFFRRSPTMTSDRERSPAQFTPGGSIPSAQAQSSFESVFGPSYSSQPPSGPPPTSFRTESQSDTPQRVSTPPQQISRAPDSFDGGTPQSSGPPSLYRETPQPSEPPPPPESRQITSSFLPLKDHLPRPDSRSSSVKVSAPASRMGNNDFAGTETPNFTSSSTETPVQEFGEPSLGEGVLPTTGGQEITSKLEDPAISATDQTQATEPQIQEAGGGNIERQSSDQSVGRDSFKDAIPGAFPGEASTPMQPTPTGGSALSEHSRERTGPSEALQGEDFRTAQVASPDPFSVGGPSPLPSTSQDDFDSAFAGFGPGGQGPDHQNIASKSPEPLFGAGPTSVNTSNKEFPPIEEFGNDDESDSASEHGFDDDFTTSSPPSKTVNASQGQDRSEGAPAAPTNEASAGSLAPRPPFTTAISTASTASQLPTPGAQKSPPTYIETTSPFGQQPPGESTQFPPEFNGLLPSREDPTSPPGSPEQAGGSSKSPGEAVFGSMSAAKDGEAASRPPVYAPSWGESPDTPASTFPSDAYQSAASHPSAGKGPSPPVAQPSQSNAPPEDEFDRDFADLDDAKEADEQGGEEFGGPSHEREGYDEFNPVFDSPVTAKSSTFASQTLPTRSNGENRFDDFEQNVRGAAQAPSQTQAPSSNSNIPHDWDAIFAGLDSPSDSTGAGQGVAPPGGFPPKEPLQTNGRAGLGPLPPMSQPVRGAALGGTPPGNKPPGLAQLGRALSGGTDHDDPILKNLTSMGYSRGVALDTLEKFDYNINKAVDHLVRTSAKK